MSLGASEWSGDFPAGIRTQSLALMCAGRRAPGAQGPLLAINSADDERNPPETGIMERELKRVKNGRLAGWPCGAVRMMLTSTCLVKTGQCTGRMVVRADTQCQIVKN
jgi:hypothetical protein